MATLATTTSDREAAIATLNSRFGDRFTRSPAVCAAHGRSEAFHADMPPEAVVYPGSTQDVQEIVRLCRAGRVPLIGFGAGTSLEGHVSAPHGGVAVDFSRMDKLLEVNAANMDCAVQPGLTREALNAQLRDTGLFFPIDPGANATIGGMAATRASGTNAVRYGTMRTNVLWLSVVLADGSVIRTARRARKTSAGYDLTALFVGSEGTLGLITKIGLRLHGQPESIVAGTCAFETLEGAVSSVVETLQLGIPVARVELLDTAQVRAVNAYSNTALDEAPTLFFEFHGSAASVAEQAETVGALVAEHGGRAFAWASRTEERNQLWAARHNAYYAAQALRPGCRLISTDVCVPIASLPQCILETQADIEATGIVAPIVGHVGDGNFHVFLTIDPDDPREIAAARGLNDRLVARALALDGTCTGEHGIGIGKQDKLIDELGEDAVGVMRAIKRGLDPEGLMNPGKIFRPD